MEVILEFFKALFALGPIGLLIGAGFLGWGAAAWLVYNGFKRKDVSDKLRENHARELRKMQDTNLGKLNNIHDEYRAQMIELTNKHNQIMLELVDKRVEDVKELTDDYAELASNTLQTLDRLIYQLEIRKTNNLKNKED